MKNQKIENMWKYIILTYIVFWVMILVIGATVSVITNSNYYAMQWVVVVCSWSPTIVLLIMFKKLFHSITIKEFYKNAFKDKLSLSSFSFSTIIILSVFFISMLFYSYVRKDSLFHNLSITAPAIFWSLLFSVFQGASGEESGWRGYLLPEMSKKYGWVKGNIILGFVWAFWHLPLWFISSGYSGLELIQYIVVFITFVVSFAILIGWIQLRCKNLFLAFWMHFLFNFLSTIVSVDILTPMMIMALLYLGIANAILIRTSYKKKMYN